MKKSNLILNIIKFETVTHFVEWSDGPERYAKTLNDEIKLQHFENESFGADVGLYAQIRDVGLSAEMFFCVMRHCFER